MYVWRFCRGRAGCFVNRDFPRLPYIHTQPRRPWFPVAPEFGNSPHSRGSVAGNQPAGCHRYVENTSNRQLLHSAHIACGEQAVYSLAVFWLTIPGSCRRGKFCVTFTVYAPCYGGRSEPKACLESLSRLFSFDGQSDFHDLSHVELFRSRLSYLPGKAGW